MTGKAAAWIALLLSTLMAAAPEARPASEPVTLSGTFLLFSEALKPSDIPFDSEPVAKQVVLKEDDGVIVPILSDDASRALFLDERLRHHRAEVHARRYPGLPFLQVVSFKIDDQGTLRTPEYFCEVCTISVRFPQICPCCQGDMILRFRDDPR